MRPACQLIHVTAEPGTVGQVCGPVFGSKLVDQLFGLGISRRVADRFQEVRCRTGKRDDQSLGIGNVQRVPDQGRDLADDAGAIGAALLRRIR